MEPPGINEVTQPNWRRTFSEANHGPCCMTSNCALADACARQEEGAGRHLLSRTDADIGEEPIRQPDNTTTWPFFIDKNGAAGHTLTHGAGARSCT
jgi:hypothetical protein